MKKALNAALFILESFGGDFLVGDVFLVGDGLYIIAAFLAFRAVRLLFEASLNARANSSFFLRLCSALFLAYKDSRLALDAAVNTFANSRRDIFVFGLLGRGIFTVHTYFLRDPRKSTLASTRLI